MCGSGHVLPFLDCPEVCGGCSQWQVCPGDLPRRLVQSPRGPPARLAGPAALRLPGMTTVTEGEARSRLLPPRHCSPLPLSRPGQGHPLTLGPAPGSFPLPQAACLKPIPRSHSWPCGFDVRLKGCVFFPRGAFHELLTKEGNKALCKFLS